MHYRINFITTPEQSGFIERSRQVLGDYFMPHSILCPWISIPTCPRVYWSMTKSVQEGGKRQVVLSPRSVSWRLFCRRLRHSARAEEVGVAQVIVPLKDIFNWTQTHSTCSQLIWLNRPSAPGNVVPLKSIRHLALCWHSIFFFPPYMRNTGTKKF